MYLNVEQSRNEKKLKVYVTEIRMLRRMIAVTTQQRIRTPTNEMVWSLDAFTGLETALYSCMTNSRIICSKELGERGRSME